MIQGIQNISFSGGKQKTVEAIAQKGADVTAELAEKTVAKGIDVIKLAAAMPKALPAPKPYTIDTFVSSSSVHSDVEKYSKQSANDLVAHLFSIGKNKSSSELPKTATFSDILADGYGYTNPASFTIGHNDGGRSLYLKA